VCAEISSETVFLYFGNDWFAENRTSSHQIARSLAEENRVLYVECPGLRSPKTSSRDVRKLLAKVARFLRGPRSVDRGIKVQTLLQIPLHRYAFIRRANQFLMIMTLKWLMFRERVHNPIAWFHVPHLSSVVGKLGERLSVYYCIDDYAALPDVDAAAVQAMDDELTRKADLVFVASDTLLESKRKLNPKTYLSPHGVDVEHFRRARSTELEAPPDVAQMPRPIIGFFGLIERWIDLDLIDFLAESRPEWSFVLIGRVAVPPSTLPQRPNLHFLGQRPYDALPAYGTAFDAAIIPYRLTRQVMHANPIKLREYLAMGTPVVSVSTPEIDKYADVVEVAHNPDAFLERLEIVLSQPKTDDAASRRIARISGEAWEARVSQVRAILAEHLRKINSADETLGLDFLNKVETDLP